MPVPRIDIDPRDIDKFLSEKGYDVIWEKNLVCPCISKETGQAKIDCPLCFGRGESYYDPIQIRAAIQTADSQVLTRRARWKQGLEAYGQALPGLVLLITVKGTNEISFYDKITNLNAIISFSQVLTRRASSEDNEVLIDLLKYKAIVLEYCRNESTIFTENTDYEITAEGNIKWIGDIKPADGTRYSIRYTMHPAYVIFDLTHVIRYTNVKKHYESETAKTLPRQALAKLDFLMASKAPEFSVE